MIRIMVDLPAPLSPTRATSSGCPILKVMLRRAKPLPNDLETLRSSTSGMSMSLSFRSRATHDDECRASAGEPWYAQRRSPCLQSSPVGDAGPCVPDPFPSLLPTPNLGPVWGESDRAPTLDELDPTEDLP